MTNPDREELVMLADFWERKAEFDRKMLHPSDRTKADDYVEETAKLFRRLASSDSGVKGEPEPVAWRWRSYNSTGPFTYSETEPEHHSDYPTEPLYTAPPADAGMPDEVGWLIEKDDPPVYHLLSADYNEQWTGDAGRAVRFAREEDAQAYVDHVGWTTPPIRVVEHMWPALTAPGPSDPSSTRSEVTVDELAAFLDPGAFSGSATDRHRHCSPWLVETVQDRARDKARALLDQFEIRRK